MSVEYTYEKVNDYIVDIIKTETIISNEEITIEGLRTVKLGYEGDKVDLIAAHDNAIAVVDTKITLQDTHIAAAEALGVQE